MVCELLRSNHTLWSPAETFELKMNEEKLSLGKEEKANLIVPYENFRKWNYPRRDSFPLLLILIMAKEEVEASFMYDSHRVQSAFSLLVFEKFRSNCHFVIGQRRINR